MIDSPLLLAAGVADLVAICVVAAALYAAAATARRRQVLEQSWQGLPRHISNIQDPVSSQSYKFAHLSSAILSPSHHQRIHHPYITRVMRSSIDVRKVRNDSLSTDPQIFVPATSLDGTSLERAADAATDPYSLLRGSQLRRLVEAVSKMETTADNQAIVQPYLSAIEEVCSLFSLFGLKYSFVTLKLGGYGQTIRERLAEYRAYRRPVGDVTLNDLVQDEIERGVTARNEGKNARNGKISASRSLLRLMRFGDFFLAIFANLSSRPTWSFAKCAQTAYAQTLKRRDSVAMQMGVTTILSMLPNRRLFFDVLGIKDTPETMRQLKNLSDKLNSTNRSLWKLYYDNGIDNLA